MTKFLPNSYNQYSFNLLVNLFVKVEFIIYQGNPKQNCYLWLSPPKEKKLSRSPHHLKKRNCHMPYTCLHMKPNSKINHQIHQLSTSLFLKLNKRSIQSINYVYSFRKKLHVTKWKGKCIRTCICICPRNI